MGLYISDGHHTYLELERECAILASIASGRVSDCTLSLIESMYETVGSRSVIDINKLIRYFKKKGYSTKKLRVIGESFEDLYNARLNYIRIICNQYPELSFKTKKHYDEENDPMFDGDFMVGLNTPKGVACFHVKLENYDLYRVPEIEHGPMYDGYSSSDVLLRLCSLVIPESSREDKIPKTSHTLKKNMDYYKKNGKRTL